MTGPARPVIEVPDTAEDARAAVDALVADLQEGWDTGDADVTDRRMAAHIAWGSPFGATVGDFATLYAATAGGGSRPARTRWSGRAVPPRPGRMGTRVNPA